MKNRKIYSALAAGAAFALVLTSCSTADSGSGNKAGTEGVKGGTVAFTVGKDEYNGFNSLTSKTYSTSNAVINDRMQPGYGYFDASGNWVNGTDLGKYEKLSDDPLTIKYTINEKAVYQDGTPITCEDAYFDWVSQNPQWILDAQQAAGKLTKDGDPAPLFDHVSDSNSYAIPVQKGPECEAGAKEFTIVYSEPNPDWQLVVSGHMPSHVVARHVGMSKEELFQAMKNKDYATAQKAAEFWSEWSQAKPGELPAEEDAPSWGPYALKPGGWTAGQYVTLMPNPKWWGEPVKVDELVVRQISSESQLQALQNQEVNIIEPQATQDTLSTLKSYSDVEILEGDTMIWEHLDYNFGENSIFSDANGGLALREAFAYCVPRADIVETLIKPLNPNAQVMDLREYFPNNPKYSEVKDAAYDGRYDKVDEAKAKEKIAESGVTNPVVRIGYMAPNPRRANTVAMIKSACDPVGFDIQDISSDNFLAPGGAVENGTYDIALFAWSGSGQIVSGANIYKSGAPQNFGKYANATVDAEWDKVLTSLDTQVELDAKKAIEKELWNTLFGIPLYAHPGIAAHTSGLLNVERNVTQSGIPWNAEKWAWQQLK